MAILDINKKLLPLKVNYFLVYASHSCLIPFVAVYAKEMGIRADIMGYIYAVISCITLFSKPLIGGLVDHFQKLKAVFISLALIEIAATMGLNFIPVTFQKSPTYVNSSLICLQNSSYVLSYELKECSTVNISSCFDARISSCSMCQVNSEICMTSIAENFTYGKERVHIPLNCTQAFLEKCGTDKETLCNEECIGDSVNCSNESKVSTTAQTWLFVIFTTVIYICYGSIGSLTDAACFNALRDKPQLFGRQMMWGTIGWGTFGLISGYLNQIFTGDSKAYSFSAGFYLMAVLMLINIIVLTKLEVNDVKPSKSIFKDVGGLVGKPKIIHFIFQVFFSGVFVGFTRVYLFWYLRSLNASQLILGLNVVTKAFLGVLPFFFFSGWIIKKIGHVNTFTMSFSAHGVLFLYYSFLSNPWWSLPIAPLEGPCFATLYAAMTSYAKIISPTGTEATVQGVVSVTYEGLGFATGNFLGGYVFQLLGGQTTFFWTGIVSFTCAMMNSIANATFIVKDRKP